MLYNLNFLLCPYLKRNNLPDISFLPQLFNSILPGLCNVIYYQGDKKYHFPGRIGLTKNVQNWFPIILRYSNFFDLCSCLRTICHRHQLYIFFEWPLMKNQYRSFLCMWVFTDFLVSKALCNDRVFAELELKVGH